MKVLRSSALRTGRLYPRVNIPVIHFCWRLVQPQGYSAAGRVVSMKNSNETIGNRTHNLPTSRAHACPLRLNSTYTAVLYNEQSVLHADISAVCTENLANLVSREIVGRIHCHLMVKQEVDKSGKHYPCFCTFRVIRSPHATRCCIIICSVCKYGNTSTVKKAEMQGHEDGKRKAMKRT
jgi:hypothetical protein